MDQDTRNKILTEGRKASKKEANNKEEGKRNMKTRIKYTKA
jgi:hypothetical protein